MHEKNVQEQYDPTSLSYILQSLKPGGAKFNTGCIHHLKGPGMEMQYIVFGLTLRSILI